MSTEQQNGKKVQPKALVILAEIISHVFHPVFFPILMALALYKLDPASFMTISPKQLGLWFISIAVTAVLFPLFSIALMKPLGFIGSFRMETARERTIPLMATMIFYFWVTHVFSNMPGTAVPLPLRVLLLGNFWGIIVVFVINIFTKISMHTSVAGGMIGIVIVLMKTSSADMTLPLIIAIAVAGVIGTARMIVGAHQRGDVWLGYIIGILVQYCAYLYLR